MKKRLLKDTWFQMFAAIGGVACVVSILGGPSVRRAAPAAPTAAAAAAPAAKSAYAPAAAQAPSPASALDEVITPAPASSSDLATYSGATAGGRSPAAMVMPPAPQAPPAPAAPAAASGASSPPTFTLTGTGVGNTQGLPAASGGGLSGINSLLNSLMGVPQSAPRALPAQAALPPFNRVTPSRPGIITVGPAGATGADTSSLRDAAFSAGNDDLILVKPGTYDGPIEIAGKSVRIRGTGARAGEVTVKWTGPGATVSVRGGALDLERIRVERGASYAYPQTEPGGAVYAIASTLTMRKAELSSVDPSAPPLIVEQGGKPSRVAAEDSLFSGSTANVLVRGPVKVRLERVTFNASGHPLAAWIDAVVELVDCRFDGGAGLLIHAYEGARATVTGRHKPPVNTVRGSQATAFEESFGETRAPSSRGGFVRDIFRRGRQAGSLP